MWIYQVPPTFAKLLKYVDVGVGLIIAMRRAHSQTAQCERYQCFPYTLKMLQEVAQRLDQSVKKWR